MKHPPGRDGKFSVFRLRGGTLLLGGILLGVLLALPGCRGCNSDDSDAEKQKKEEAEKKKKEKPKPPFQWGKEFTEPTNRRQAGLPCKPGHWAGYYHEQVKANHFDFVGEMELSLTDNKTNQPVRLSAATPFTLTTDRQAVLPKGQEKNLSSVFYVPRDIGPTKLDSRINSSGGSPVLESSLLLTRMPSYQYHFVVLARFYERYKYLDHSYSIRPCVWPKDALILNEKNKIQPFYLVSLISGEKPPPLPAHAAEWSSIACVLWDDARPTIFDEDLKNALLDWLHWGGVLIISGPTSLDGLRGSFLEPYLPATATQTRELGADSLAALGTFGPEGIPPIKPIKPWSGVKLEKDPRASWTPRCGGLLAERRLGRGRIVVSAFRLTEGEFHKWPGRDQFFNAFLLRRPARRFTVDSVQETTAWWADPSKSELRDAAWVTSLRYFARDEGLQRKDYAPDLITPRPMDVDAWDTSAMTMTEEEPPSGPGLAAWNDFSPVADAARKNLLLAARVKVPDLSFVICVLTIYLMVLVPLNWSIFKTLGRVEWAWFAAPVIALVCTGLVIKLAQLDIGFVRARTELAVLEIQGDYPRAHLTRYNALYTSLTTSYDFRFDDGYATALPFPKYTQTKQMSPDLEQLRYRPGDQALLSGLPVSSNSTGLLHSEEVFTLDGKLALSPGPSGVTQITNHTKLALQGAGIIEKTASGNLKIAWVGNLEPGAIRNLSWSRESSAEDGGKLWADRRDEHPLSAVPKTADVQGELNLRPLLDLAQRTGDMRPGDRRLVAWTDRELPGLEITPHSSQGRFATLVVAHLAYGDPPAPQPDVNIPQSAVMIREEEPVVQ
ncbi:MAG: hypothetical protein JXB10_06125 [Pirellulales bacterium]|nr:hypothetical protein [Pirellulales bacterium]